MNPVTAAIEITSACSFKCGFCYNWWQTPKSMTQEQLDVVLTDLIKNGVKHIIFTGGEPLLNKDVLKHGIKRVAEEGLTCTLNSTVSTPETVESFKSLGVDHILVSFSSHSLETTEKMRWVPGAWGKTVTGIVLAVSAGIRITINMVITKKNMNDVYKTAQLTHALGATKFMGTRCVPVRGEAALTPEEIRMTLKELLRVKRDFNMDVGTLVAIPFCFIGETYGEYYSHGCPAGTKMIVISPSGDARACAHNDSTYGNVFELGVKKAWENMKAWRSGELLSKQCKSCALLSECNGGCRFCSVSRKHDSLIKKGFK